jgi:hypothetical protein
MPMHPLHAMTGTLPRKVMTLHHTSEPAALADAKHINKRNIGKNVNAKLLANIQAVFFTVGTKFTHKPLWLTARPWQRLTTRSNKPLLPLATQRHHMATLATTGKTPRLVAKPQLNRLIAIGLNRPQLQHNARTGLYDRDGNQVARLVVHLRHSNLAAEQSDWHQSASFF